MDIAGIALIGILGALAVNGVKSTQPGSRIGEILRLLSLEGQPFQVQVGLLGCLATFLLLLRTFFSITFTRRILFFMSASAAKISANLIDKLLSSQLIVVQQKTTQETIYFVTQGVNAIVLGVIATSANLISDMSLLFLLGFGLLIADTTMALSTIVFFGLVGLLLYKRLSERSNLLGQLNSQLEIASREKLEEAIIAFRELVVRNRRFYYSQFIGGMRLELSNTLAELSFLPNISKYIIETGVILGALLISAIQFVLMDATHAISTLAIFMAAGTRVAPAVLRLQQGFIQIKSSIGIAETTLLYISEIGWGFSARNGNQEFEIEHKGFRGQAILKDVQFRYPSSKANAITNLNLEIKDGSFVAIVGPSGAGKSTLADLLLGVLVPDHGLIEISGSVPADVTANWPGAIGYVPQRTTAFHGTIKENICLGFDASKIEDRYLIDPIQISQLTNLIDSLPLGIYEQVGDHGNRLSGGEKQRLGIARALFTKPKLLVLDEATSALDGETEAAISSAIQELKGKTTIIMIAHRLSTIRFADVVVYMQDGEVIASGTFDSVRERVTSFDRQATLMGL